MKPLSIAIFLTTFFVISLSHLSHAQTKGNISGKIIDSKTGEELIGASVGVKGTTIGAQADLDGKYFLSLAPGVYDLQVIYISYKTKEIKGVEVKAGETVFLNISVDEDVSELQEV
ncbi:MAG: carboxypeptidase-like regulatory domain-containing protein, partial [Cytophagales bacterium]|nr:carboxypeptidase-like regulatory domain-containing protein [Cytophagales bacterium]